MPTYSLNTGTSDAPFPIIPPSKGDLLDIDKPIDVTETVVMRTFTIRQLQNQIDCLQSQIDSIQKQIDDSVQALSLNITMVSPPIQEKP